MENNQNLEYITLSDGEQEIELLLLDTFGIDDKNYASFLDEEEQQMYIMEMEEVDGEATFLPIEDEKELEEILALYEEILDESEEDDEDFEEEE